MPAFPSNQKPVLAVQAPQPLTCCMASRYASRVCSGRVPLAPLWAMIQGLLLLSGRFWGLRAAPRVYRLTRTMVKEHKHHVNACPSCSRGLFFGVPGRARAKCCAGVLGCDDKPALGVENRVPAR